MVVNRKVTGKAMSVTGGVIVGTIVSLLVSLVGSLVVTWLIDEMTVTEAGYGYGAMITLLVSAVVGTWIAASLVKRQRLVVCLVTGALYFLMLLGITAFFFGGQYQGIMPTVMLVAGGSVGSALMGNLGNRTQVSHKRRYG